MLVVAGVDVQGVDAFAAEHVDVAAVVVERQARLDTVGSQVVHRSKDRGDSWEVISPDLTRADPSTLETTPGIDDDPDTGPYWGPIKRDNTGIEWYATIFAFAESPLTPGLLWAGSDDGYIHVSRDNGDTWTEVTPDGFIEP